MHIITRTQPALLLALAFSLAGCGRSASDKEAARGDTSAAPPAGGADTLKLSMGGMQMNGMQGMGMMATMRAHMDSMGRVSPEQMKAMMAGHEDLASRMMDAMGADMSGMHMTPDAAWTALADSVRQDLADLPALSGEALKRRMQAHMDRMQRLIARHQSMMEGMKSK
jgi:hypothetical protein